jgi:nucleoside-diphosphate-sugar epimerase
MHIAIVGAGGRTGVHVVRRALDNGHQVIAFARSPGKIHSTHDRLTIRTLDFIAGDAEARLAEGLAGVDALISALGPDASGKPAVMGLAAQRMIHAAKRAGVRRIVWMTGAGVKFPGDAPSAIRLLVRGIMKLVAGKVLLDSEKAANTIACSDLDWTIARAPMLNDEAASGTIMGSDIPPKPVALSRDGIAAFMLDCVEQKKFIRSAPFLSQGELL